VRVDGDAAAIIPDHDFIAGPQKKLDDGGMAGNGFVHGIIEDFRGEVVQRGLVCAANIHARPAANGLQSFQDLDVLGGVIGLRAAICK
jgi:hypothetical protein